MDPHVETGDVPPELSVSDLPEGERLALESAAGGWVSGALVEWPQLRRAFKRLGLRHEASLGYWSMVRQAREALRNGRRK